MHLENSTARRAGKTARRWDWRKHEVHAVQTSEALRLSLQINSKGGGDTDIQIDIGIKDFPIVLSLMCATNRRTTMKLLSRELTRQIGQQTRIDKEVTEAAYRKVRDLAFKKHMAARSKEYTSSKLRYAHVEALVESLLKIRKRNRRKD